MARLSKSAGKNKTYEAIVHHTGEPGNVFAGFIIKAKDTGVAEPKARKHAKKHGLVFDFLIRAYSISDKLYLYPQAK